MQTLKATLDWQGRPLIIYQIEQLLATNVNQIVVVLGFKADELTALIKKSKVTGRVTIATNVRYAQGRTTSIITGVRKVPTSDAVVMLSVDQPRPASVLQRLIDAHAKGKITIPAFGDKHGHPPIYDASMREDLLAITEGTEGLKSVNKRHEKDIRYVPFDSDAVLVNLNRPQDYEKAHAKYGIK